MRKVKEIVKKYGKEYMLLTLLLAIMCLILFRKYIFGGNYYFFQGTDSVRTTFPAYYSLAKYFDEGWSWWSFHMGIGASQLSRFTAMSDPFNYVLYFNHTNIERMIILAVSLRVIFAGVFFYSYLNVFEFKKEAKLLSSIAYAFSGYMIIMGQNYGFATVCVYLPLLLLGVEHGIRDGKYVFFCLLVFLTSVYFNTLFFVCSIIVIIYFFIRFFMIYGFKLKLFAKKTFAFLGYAILGIGIGAFWTIPVTYLTGQSPRIGAIAQKNMFLEFDVNAFFTAFARMFSNNSLGIMVNGQDYVGYARQYMQLSTYTTVFALLMLSLIIVNICGKKQIFAIVGIVSVGFLFYWNGFSYIMNACSTITYRWSFAFNFVLAFVIAYGINLVLNNKNIKLFQPLFIICVALNWYIFIIYLMFSRNNEQINGFYNFIQSNKGAFYLPFVLVAVYAFILYCFKSDYLCKNASIILITFVMMSEIFMNYNTFVNYQNSYGKQSEKTTIEYFDESMDFISHIQEEDKEFYRIEKLFDSLYRSDGLPSDNDAMVQRYYGLKNYSSLNPVGYIKFLQNMGIYVMCPLESVDQTKVKPEDIKSSSLNFINGVGDRTDLMSYLGVKYVIVDTEKEHFILPESYLLVETYGKYECYKNENYNPLVFATYQSVLNEEFKDLSVNDKDYVIFSTTIVDDEEDEFLKSISDILADSYTVNQLMEQNRSNFRLKKFDEDFITGEISVKYNGYLNTTIPYDKGWNIYIDGKKAETLSLNNGLLGCKITEGTHEIEMKYFPYGMKLGLIVSVICVAILYMVNKFEKTKRLNNPGFVGSSRLRRRVCK